MTFQTLQKFNQDEANPFDVVHTSSDTYVASDRELVITEANKVSLPAPEKNAIVGIRDTGQRAVITSPSGQIHLREDGVIRAEETVYFVSDGTNWYTISDSEWFRGVIPDTLCRPEDESTGNTSSERGLQFELKEEFEELGFKISELGDDNHEEAYLINTETDTTEVTKTFDTDLGSGDTFAIEFEFEADVRYAIETKNTAGEYGRNPDPDLPTSNDDIVILSGSRDKGNDVTEVANISCIGNPDGVLE